MIADPDEETEAEMYRRVAAREREHISKYPDCVDRDKREALIALYERYATECEAAS